MILQWNSGYQKHESNPNYAALSEYLYLAARVMGSFMCFKIVQNPQIAMAARREAKRSVGISGFMRVKNGADFVDAAIRSHMPYLDEIVVVLNGSIDSTPDTLGRLSSEFGQRLRVFNYLPEVFPPGSNEHAAESPKSPKSFVYMSNFALAQTRYSAVVKVDDDHVALGEALDEVCRKIRSLNCQLDEFWAISGINIAYDWQGHLGIPLADPVSGSGDIGFFTPSDQTIFRHDVRFERFHRGGLPVCFAGFLYWHMKYLKVGYGFANYDLDRYPESRFHRKRDRFQMSDIVSLTEFTGRMTHSRHPIAWLESRLTAKGRMKAERDRSLASVFHHATVEEAIASTSPEFVDQIIRASSQGKWIDIED